MLHHMQVSKLKRLIKDYAETMVADSWAGSADPLDYESLRESHVEAEAKLEAYLSELTGAGSEK